MSDDKNFTPRARLVLAEALYQLKRERVYIEQRIADTEILAAREKFCTDNQGQPVRPPPLELPLYPMDGPPCKTDSHAPHGFDRNASHSEGRYVCDCEAWVP